MKITYINDIQLFNLFWLLFQKVINQTQPTRPESRAHVRDTYKSGYMIPCGFPTIMGFSAGI